MNIGKEATVAKARIVFAQTTFSFKDLHQDRNFGAQSAVWEDECFEITCQNRGTGHPRSGGRRRRKFRTSRQGHRIRKPHFIPTSRLPHDVTKNEFQRPHHGKERRILFLMQRPPVHSPKIDSFFYLAIKTCQTARNLSPLSFPLARLPPFSLLASPIFHKINVFCFFSQVIQSPPPPPVFPSSLGPLPPSLPPSSLRVCYLRSINIPRWVSKHGR